MISWISICNWNMVHIKSCKSYFKKKTKNILTSWNNLSAVQNCSTQEIWLAYTSYFGMESWCKTHTKQKYRNFHNIEKLNAYILIFIKKKSVPKKTKKKQNILNKWDGHCWHVKFVIFISPLWIHHHHHPQCLWSMCSVWRWNVVKRIEKAN